MSKYCWKYYVYIVKCSDQTYYTGATNDIDRRIFEHNNGYNKDCYTYFRRPVKLKYAEEYQYINDAIFREKQINGWSRAKKDALISGDERLLIELSNEKNRRKNNQAGSQSSVSSD